MNQDSRIATLADAYVAATYRWELDGRWHGLRIGQPAPEIEAAFPLARSFALLSAWDPQSIPRPENENRSADEALHGLLIASGQPFRAAFSSAANRSWREPSWVVMDLPMDELDALVRRFGQLAALAWRVAEPVRLRMYARRPLLAKAYDYVDWVAPMSSTASLRDGVRDAPADRP